MTLQLLQAFIIYTVVYAFVFEHLMYVYGQGNQEMTEHGRVQYQLLKERSTLPRYGSCWKAAIQHLDEGCRHLSEETQSDVALHITNCFLEMSGHETYNCELDRKPNLRAICINSMSDRAFNVYTEFYTHTQNICWFLRGQIWHETIAENTLKVGKQLEVTAQNQEDLLQAQKQSLQLQERMLKHGKYLEQVLEDLSISSKAHKEILSILSESVINLQAWIVGEVSWFNSVIFYIATVFLTFFLTSTKRTMSARFPIVLLLFLNLIIERFICSSIISKTDGLNTHILYNNISDVIWYSRYSFVFISIFILIYYGLFHRDLHKINNELLTNIQEQNNNILRTLKDLKNIFYVNKDNLNMISERVNGKSLNNKQNNVKSWYEDNPTYKSSYDILDDSYLPNLCITQNYRESPEVSKENLLNNSKNVHLSKRMFSPLRELENGRYNLRSRQGSVEPINR